LAEGEDGREDGARKEDEDRSDNEAEDRVGEEPSVGIDDDKDRKELADKEEPTDEDGRGSGATVGCGGSGIGIGAGGGGMSERGSFVVGSVDVVWGKGRVEGRRIIVSGVIVTPVTSLRLISAIARRSGGRHPRLVGDFQVQ
jgi:hypothetical protein